jgi:hypothetical protein
MSFVLWVILGTSAVQIMCLIGLIWMARRLEVLFPPDTTVWIRDSTAPVEMEDAQTKAAVPQLTDQVAHLMNEIETETEHHVKIRSKTIPKLIRYKGVEYIQTRTHPEGHLVYRRCGTF